MELAVPEIDDLALSKRDYEKLADFRYQIRKFVRFSEEVARAHGITPLQYLMMLHIKGYPGRDWATVGEIAERLQKQQHGVVALISRCEKLGFVTRRRSAEDKRRIEIHLLASGEQVLEQIARLHRSQLLDLHGRFAVPEFVALDSA